MSTNISCVDIGSSVLGGVVIGNRNVMEGFHMLSLGIRAGNYLNNRKNHGRVKEKP